MPQVPVDKDVRIGHLDNGLTYYIRHNNFPEHVASFYIAQKVGSINENDDQRGLAHLLEHLAFNGSEHFQGNSLQNYLQSIGVEYGKNLNAYTSIDKTVYYFTDVPTTRTTAVDSCMLILKDWSNGISLTQKAIDDERDVVHNEYRMRMVGQQRIMERSLPALYPGSKYGYRMPIGLMSIIDGCDPETLRAYYRKWYRPDNQAIIIVGDIDVDHIEAQIKKLFSGIKVPANAAKVIPELVPDNDTAIYVVDKDKEQNYDVAMISMKHDATPDSLKGSLNYFATSYVQSAITSMLSSRLGEKSLEADCPYLQAGCDNGSYLVSRTKDAFSLTAVAKPGKMLEAYAAVLREAKRAKDFGFTATEYVRYKEDFMSGLDKMYSNRDKMKNEQFTSQYVDHFISNEPIPSVEVEHQIYKTMVPSIPVEAINAYAKELICETDTNFVTLLMMRDAEGAVYPTKQQLADVVKQVRGEKLEAYVDNVKQEPLMAELPKAGKIKKTTENKLFGYKMLTLSNGAKVVLKFKNVETLPVKGEVVNKFTKAMENPQDVAVEIWCSEAPYTLRNSVLADIAARVINMDYNRNIREKLSAAYYAGADAMESVKLDGKTMRVGFTGNAMMNPDKSKDAIPYFYSGLKDAMEQPNLDDLQKVKEILLKQADVNCKQNGYWMGVISEYLLYGIDTHTNYKKEVSSVDAKAVSDFLKNVVMKDGNHVEVIMHATKAGEAK